MDSAIIPDMTLGAAFVPKTSVKNKVAMSSWVSSLSSNDTAHNYKIRGLQRIMFGMTHTYAIFARTNRTDTKTMAMIVDMAKYFFGLFTSLSTYRHKLSAYFQKGR